MEAEQEPLGSIRRNQIWRDEEAAPREQERDDPSLTPAGIPGRLEVNYPQLLPFHGVGYSRGRCSHLETPWERGCGNIPWVKSPWRDPSGDLWDETSGKEEQGMLIP